MNLSAKIAAIELDGDDVRVAVVKTGRRLPVVLELHAARATYGSAEGRIEALADAVKSVVGRIKNRPAAYVLCAGAQQSIARTLLVPFRGKSRVSAAMRFELEPYLAFPIEELIVDHSIIREVDGGTEALVIGMRKAVLEEQLAILSSAGVDPEGIGIDAAGLVALWQAQRRNVKGIAAVLHVRNNYSILAVTQDKTLAYVRVLPITVDSLREEPAAAVREIQNSLRAFNAGRKDSVDITELTITGAEELPDDSLTMPVRYVQLLDGLKGPGMAHAGDTPDSAPMDGDGAQEMPGDANSHHSNGRLGNGWEAVIGVALGGAGGGPAYDFRKDELGQRSMMRGVARHAVFSAVLAAILLVVYGGLCYLNYRHSVAEVDRLGQEIWDTFTSAFPNSPRIKDGRHSADRGGSVTKTYFEEEMSKTGTKDRTLSADVFRRPTLLDIMADIAERLPGDKVVITELKVAASDGVQQRVTIKGEIKDSEGFNQAVEKLKQSPILAVTEEPTRSSKDNIDTFTTTVNTREKPSGESGGNTTSTP